VKATANESTIVVESAVLTPNDPETTVDPVAIVFIM